MDKPYRPSKKLCLYVKDITYGNEYVAGEVLTKAPIVVADFVKTRVCSLVVEDDMKQAGRSVDDCSMWNLNKTNAAMSRENAHDISNKTFIQRPRTVQTDKVTRCKLT